ncbi:hypothetical protein THAOC_05704, partial [Thalassiosira oceanica]
MSAEEYAALANHAGLFREAHSEPGAVVSAPLSEVHPAMAAAAGIQRCGQSGRSGLNGRLEVAPSSELDGLRLFAVLDVGLAAGRDPVLRRLVEGNLGRGLRDGTRRLRLDDALSMPDGGWPYDCAAVGIGTADDVAGGSGRRGRLTSVRAVCLALVYRWGEDDAIDLPDLPHYTSTEGRPFVVTHLHVDSAIRGRGLGTYLIQCLQTLYRTLGRGRPKLLLAAYNYCVENWGIRGRGRVGVRARARGELRGRGRARRRVRRGRPEGRAGGVSRSRCGDLATRSPGPRDAPPKVFALAAPRPRSTRLVRIGRKAASRDRLVELYKSLPAAEFRAAEDGAPGPADGAARPSDSLCRQGGSHRPAPASPPGRSRPTNTPRARSPRTKTDAASARGASRRKTPGVDARRLERHPAFDRRVQRPTQLARGGSRKKKKTPGIDA